MAFVLQNFAKLSTAGNQNSPQLFSYISASDNIATITESGYFLGDNNFKLELDDLLYITATDSQNFYYITGLNPITVAATTAAGSGNVIGPVSSVIGAPALFSNTSGTALKSGVLNGTKWYVDSNNGSDSNSGQSEFDPFLTMGKAVSVWSGGDIIINMANSTPTDDVTIGAGSFSIISEKGASYAGQITLNGTLYLINTKCFNKLISNGIIYLLGSSISNIRSGTGLVAGLVITAGVYYVDSNSSIYASGGDESTSILITGSLGIYGSVHGIIQYGISGSATSAVGIYSDNTGNSYVDCLETTFQLVTTSTSTENYACQVDAASNTKINLLSERYNIYLSTANVKQTLWWVNSAAAGGGIISHNPTVDYGLTNTTADANIKLCKTSISSDSIQAYNVLLTSQGALSPSSLITGSGSVLYSYIDGTGTFNTNGNVQNSGSQSGGQKRYSIVNTATAANSDSLFSLQSTSNAGGTTGGSAWIDFEQLGFQKWSVGLWSVANGGDNLFHFSAGNFSLTDPLILSGTFAKVTGTLQLAGSNAKLSLPSQSSAPGAAICGTGTLSAGVLNITTTAVTANSKIFLTPIGATAPLGSLFIHDQTPSVGFSARSSNVGDNVQFNWLIIEAS